LNSKARFSHRTISPHEECTKDFQVLAGEQWCKEMKENQKYLREIEKPIMAIGNSNIPKQINVSESINKLSLICVL
jgi:3-phosphoglycerate kinase